MLFGAHESVSGGVPTAFPRAKTDGCRALQIFTKNSNQWKEPVLADEIVAAFRAARDSYGAPLRVMAHTSYLINLATDDREILAKSMASLVAEIERSSALGVDYVVLHPGAHLGAGDDVGLARVCEALDEVHARTPNATARVLLENTAGQGSCVGHRFEHLQAIFEGTKTQGRLGVCFDTQHAFAAGYDLSTRAGYEKTFRDFDATVGLSRLMAFHLNDSKKPLGARVDRHEHIGEGLLGLATFWRLAHDARFAEKSPASSRPSLGRTKRGRAVPRRGRAPPVARERAGAGRQEGAGVRARGGRREAREEQEREAMIRALPLVVPLALAAFACSGAKPRPNLPPPEYEEAETPAMDASAPPSSPPPSASSVGASDAGRLKHAQRERVRALLRHRRCGGTRHDEVDRPRAGALREGFGVDGVPVAGARRDVRVVLIRVQHEVGLIPGKPAIAPAAPLIENSTFAFAGSVTLYASTSPSAPMAPVTTAGSVSAWAVPVVACALVDSVVAAATVVCVTLRSNAPPPAVWSRSTKLVAVAAVSGMLAVSVNGGWGAPKSVRGASVPYWSATFPSAGTMTPNGRNVPVLTVIEYVRMPVPGAAADAKSVPAGSASVSPVFVNGSVSAVGVSATIFTASGALDHGPPPRCFRR